MTPAIQQRFEEKFTKTDTCWLWHANKLPKGYGLFKLHGTMARAHRVAYELYKGPFEKTLHVLHTCDNPSCVNPDHLWLGTNADNVKDKKMKGRAQGFQGAENPRALLTKDQVIEMRALWATKQISQGRLAKQFGIKLGTVSGIVNGTAWRDL